MARVAQAEAVECPRCGYDVSGVMSLWKAECPVEGRCSECGYEYQWKHLLGPNLGVPKWFFETAHRKKIRAAISTSVRTLAPWHFWKRVPLHAPFRVHRMVLLAGVMLIVAYGASVAALSVPYLLQLVFPNAPWSHMGKAWNGWVFPFARRMGMLGGIAADMARWPLGESYDHLRRHFNFVVLWIVLANTLMPLGFLAITQTLQTQRVRMLHVIRASVCGWVATMVALSVWFLVALVGLLVALFWAPSQRLYWRDPGMGGEALVLLWPVVMVGWWWCVCRHYLRVRHAFWVALLMPLMALLGGAVVLYPVIMTPMFWYELGQWWPFS